MNHTWNQKPKPFELTDSGQKRLTMYHVCRTCGCERLGYRHKQGHFFVHVRSGQVFSNRAPDCIDWEVENAKTID